MACRGVFFALDDEDRRLLLAARDDEEALGIASRIEDRWDKDWLCGVDKAWDPIHRCLTDGKLSTRGNTVLSRCVLGGHQLFRGNDCVISFLESQEVQEIAIALLPIQQSWFRQRYFSLQKKILCFTYSSYEGPIGEEDFAYSWSYFEAIRQFYQKAAEAGRAVIFTVDQ